MRILMLAVAAAGLAACETADSQPDRPQRLPAAHL